MMARWLPVCVLLTFQARAYEAEAAPAADPADEALLRAEGITPDGQGLLEFFRRRTCSPEDEKRAADLVRQLGDERYEVRQRASAALVALGAAAVPHLTQAAKDHDPEVKRRSRECLEQIAPAKHASLAGAAVRLLAVRAPDGATEALVRFLPWARDETVEEEATQALLVLARRTGRPDPALTTALADPSPVRRGAAALIVARLDEAAQRERVRRLLQDDEPLVRLRAAQGLLAAGRKEAVPTLISLLAGPAPVAGQAEELLSALAGAKAPNTSHPDPDRRTVWQTWWKAHQAEIEPGRLGADALVFSPMRRAAAVTRRFLDGLVRGDATAVRATTALPLSIAGGRTMLKAADVDEFVREVHGRALERGIRCEVREVVTGEEYVRKQGEPAGNAAGLPPWRELCVVHAVILVKDRTEPDEGVYVIVRVTGAARILVLGSAGKPPRR
jgi:hypothetical protein